MKLVNASLALLAAGSHSAFAAASLKGAEKQLRGDQEERALQRGDDGPAPEDPNVEPGAPTVVSTTACGGGEGECNPASVDTKQENCNAQRGVRCCSDTELTGWEKNEEHGCSVWARVPGDANPCRPNKTCGTAELLCTVAGGRLCTVGELLGKCAKGTGCGFDDNFVWAADPPTPSPTPHRSCEEICSAVNISGSDVPVLVECTESCDGNGMCQQYCCMGYCLGNGGSIVPLTSEPTKAPTKWPTSSPTTAEQGFDACKNGCLTTSGGCIQICVNKIFWEGHEGCLDPCHNKYNDCVDECRVNWL